MTNAEKIAYYADHIEDELADCEKYWHTYYALGKPKHLEMAKQELMHAKAYEEEARILLDGMEKDLDFIRYEEAKSLYHCLKKIQDLTDQIYT